MSVGKGTASRVWLRTSTGARVRDAGEAQLVERGRWAMEYRRTPRWHVFSHYRLGRLLGHTRRQIVVPWLVALPDDLRGFAETWRVGREYGDPVRKRLSALRDTRRSQKNHRPVWFGRNKPLKVRCQL